MQVRWCSTWNGHELPKRTTWKGVKHDSAEPFLGLTEEYSRWVAPSKSIRPVSVTWTCFNLHLSQVWWWGDEDDVQDDDDNEDDLKQLVAFVTSGDRNRTSSDLRRDNETRTKTERSLFFVCHPSCSYGLLLTLKLYICSSQPSMVRWL